MTSIVDRLLELSKVDDFMSAINRKEINSIKKQLEEEHEQLFSLKNMLQIIRNIIGSENEIEKILELLKNQRTDTDIQNAEIVDHAIKLFHKARETHNNPDSDDESKRWGFYTATALQSILGEK